MNEGILRRARAGEESAFAELTDPFRREIQLHCYRLLGSVQDAEDAVQETLVSAWRGLPAFEQRASVRGWLYTIATNRCLNVLRERSRRPRRTVGATLPFEPPPPTRRSEVPWLEPYPELLLEGLPDAAPGPEARYETREAVGLAFVSGLQRLPARQRAVLVLRDVLGFRAGEVAEQLDITEASVNSALQRARAALAERTNLRERAPAPASAAERALAGRFADAFERGEIDRVVSLLTEDAWITMPPEPHQYQGKAAIADFLSHASAAAPARRQTKLVPIRANAQPGFVQYFRGPGDEAGRVAGVLVLTLAGDQIAVLTRFALSNTPAALRHPETWQW